LQLDSVVEVVEVTTSEAASIRLVYRYVTTEYFDLEVNRDGRDWKVILKRKSFEAPVKRESESRFFEEFIDEPRAFAAALNGKQAGWLELGFHKWNNRMRVWEILVEEGFRRRGIGTLLMDHAVKLSREKGARMLVLETQSCNAPAIDFYTKYGFMLIGFDSAAYSNNDVEKKEIRLEMGLKLDS
jgi:ribosomal protein S18 acetylase RimI-like enzyme